ncbi:four-carbon acid sugar kinase family protein [Lachnospiraceae bacterium 54-53]
MSEILSMDMLESYPPVRAEELDRLWKQELEASDYKIIALDDDPTGVQTVHDVSVYTGWDVESIRQGFHEENRLFYILTNSRGFTEKRTIEIHKEIVKNICAVAKEEKQKFMIISRSDSTLRGHYPAETNVIREALKEEAAIQVDGEILCPFFREGGRFTINDVHYVKYGDELVPSGETEFARDKTFGYRASDLKEYIEEKTKGQYQAKDVISVSIEDLRKLNIDGIKAQLMAVSDFQKIIVNAAGDGDVRAFSIALYRAVKNGKQFLFRTAAAFVREAGGIESRELLTKREVVPVQRENGGMVIVGSHTAKTTEQLEELLSLEDTVGIHFHSALVLNREAFEEEIMRIHQEIRRVLPEGKCAVVYTDRNVLSLENDTEEEALLRSVRISDAVQSFVRDLDVRPGFLLAKGGITSSDIGTKGLGVKRATVMGQIYPGVPVWKTGSESKFPDMAYVIFPGNVGGKLALKQVVAILNG